MTLAPRLDPAFCLRLTETLAHFVWQGALAAGAVVFFEPALRRISAAARYGFLSAALLVMAACPVITYWLLGIATDESAPLRVERVNVSGTDPGPPPQKLTYVRPVVPAPPPPRTEAAPEIVAPAQAGEPIRKTWAERLRPYSRGVALAYLLGIAVMLGRFLLALRGGQRLRRSAVRVSRERVLSAAARQARELGLRCAPPVWACAKLAAPVLVGVLRPAVLLPLSLAAELSPDQLEAILAHELAHLRRRDHLALLVQRLIEAALFFHPAVWYVSRRIDAERENACDDLVVALGARPAEYARGLAHAAAAAIGPAPALALAATGRVSHLRRRIQRLLGKTDEPLVVSQWFPVTCIVASMTAMLIAPHLHKSTNEPGWLPLDRLLARAIELRSRVHDLTVDATDLQVDEGRGMDVNRNRVVLKGAKEYRRRRTNSFGRDNVMPASDVQMCYDGRRTAIRMIVGDPSALEKPASVKADGVVADGIAPLYYPRDVGFFRLNLMAAAPPHNPGECGCGDSNLVSLLSSPTARVRPVTETIDGHECEVVEIPGDLAVWLDLERGLLPLKQEFFVRDSERVRDEYLVTAAAEFDDGVWLAVRGVQRTFPMDAQDPRPREGDVTRIFVQTRTDGSLKLQVNRRLDDRPFDFRTAMPTGASLVDRDRNYAPIHLGGSSAAAGDEQ